MATLWRFYSSCCTTTSSLLRVETGNPHDLIRGVRPPPGYIRFISTRCRIESSRHVQYCNHRPTMLFPIVHPLPWQDLFTLWLKLIDPIVFCTENCCKYETWMLPLSFPAYPSPIQVAFSCQRKHLCKADDASFLSSYTQQTQNIQRLNTTYKAHHMSFRPELLLLKKTDQI